MTTPWECPLPLRLRKSHDPASFTWLPTGTTALPLPPHPGAFGVVRRHHVHEGIDLYAPCNTPVFAVEEGLVLSIQPFTGPLAGSPWWLDTQAVFVEGAAGVVVYGEIFPEVEVGALLRPGQKLGSVMQVLKKDKGRPLSMLHLELHAPGTTIAPEWSVGAPPPSTLRDPTPLLLPLAIRQGRG